MGSHSHGRRAILMAVTKARDGRDRDETAKPADPASTLVVRSGAPDPPAAGPAPAGRPPASPAAAGPAPARGTATGLVTGARHRAGATAAAVGRWAGRPTSRLILQGALLLAAIASMIV